MMKKNILTGALAAREYIHFFRDPIGCMTNRELERIYEEVCDSGWAPESKPGKVALPAPLIESVAAK